MASLLQEDRAAQLAYDCGCSYWAALEVVRSNPETLLDRDTAEQIDLREKSYNAWLIGRLRKQQRNKSAA